MSELSDLPHVLGGVQYVPNWRESLIESLIVLLVAVPVMMLTKRIVSRVTYLESFLRVCSWCKQLEHEDEWIPMEEFFERKFQRTTSHGICERCAKKMKSKMKKCDA